MLGVSITMLIAENADWSVSVIVNVTAVPLSSSPEPENVRPELRPIGLPVTSELSDVHVAVAPPDTEISPACADTAVKDPHNADKPTFVNLFFIYVSP